MNGSIWEIAKKKEFLINKSSFFLLAEEKQAVTVDKEIL